ncbi:hypothetical protein BV898_19226 [Hypsibius exemplaris]|uniref:DDE-1 domain-containing protein n=1 Tax=Hypsibius exemplaris TaxID=2072580 RepID=A0A9X6RP94_HYPEX|nr:hypothetical protein BV898_19226 [Hypsibius exemplaris]
MARSEFLRVVSECTKSKGLIPENVEVGDKWFRKFMQRHPKYIALLSSLHEEGYLDDPDGVFNYDESAFKLAVLYSKTLAATGTKHIYYFAAGNDRDQVTTLVCGNATGRMLRPLVLFKGALHSNEWYDGRSNQIHIAVNSSGIMDFDSLTGYFAAEVFPNRVAKKKLIFYGHYSHVYNQAFEAVYRSEDMSGIHACTVFKEPVLPVKCIDIKQHAETFTKVTELLISDIPELLAGRAELMSHFLAKATAKKPDSDWNLCSRLSANLHPERPEKNPSLQNQPAAV